MTQVGEGRETAAGAARPAVALGAPVAGEVLAERYQLEEHVNNDSAGRQVWRGVDVILRRPVAVVLRYPGGVSAAEMLQAAVDASRIVHPNLVGVYDAIDEGERSYVVREWVDGRALRDVVAGGGPLDPARAVAIAHAVAEALTAVHATDMVHGNVHPGTILIADDGRVVLADARADAADSVEADVRAVGGILYFSLTGRWPHAEAGRSSLPDASRDAAGTVAAPRQIRTGVPAYLDDLTMDLLDRQVAVPAVDALAAELSRLDAVEDFEEVGPLRFTQGTAAEPVRSTRKIVLGVGALAVIALVGLVFGINAISGSGGAPGAQPSAAVQANAGGQPAGGGPAPAPDPTKVALNAGNVRIVDPPKGDRVDGGEARFTVDDDKKTSWDTQGFNQPNFGNLKKGMGVLIDLGAPRKVTDVRVETSAPGVSMQILTGTQNFPDSSAGDDAMLKAYKPINDDGPRRTEGTREIFQGFDPDTNYQYILVFLTELPRGDDGRYRVSVSDIEVYGS